MKELKQILTREFLVQCLIDNKTHDQIAKEVGCCRRTVVYYTKKYNLNNEYGQYARILKKKFLKQEYIDKGKHVRKIAEELGIKYGAVFHYIKKFNLKRNISQKLRRKLNKKFLYEEYLLNNKTQSQIAKENNCSEITVTRLLTSYNITKLEEPIQFNNKKYGEIHGSYFSALQSRNKEFNITIEYIWYLFLKQNRKCSISGVELKFPVFIKRKKIPGTASLDRIDSKKGYVVDNVQWVHKSVNLMKMNLTQEEFIDWCKTIAEFQNTNDII